jgi:hypothetical protein
VAANNQILENGAGVALGDVDGDGWCDVFLCGSQRPSALFRNLGGWRFEDVTAAAGVACSGQFTTGAVFADVDGDGDLDLLVNGIGVGTRVFLNDGRGHFVEDTASGLARTFGATSLTLADIDGDGDLDLYVCNYRTSTMRDEPNPPRLTARRVQGGVVVSPEDRFTGFLKTDGSVEVVEKGEPDILYLNDGHGKFTPVSWTGGAFRDEGGRPLTAPPEDWGLSAILRDLNGDGSIDLYVCNDFPHSPDRFWLGDGHGGFRAAPAHAWRNMPASAMAIDVADVDRDGHEDFLVVEMLSRERALRQRQRGNVPKVEWNLPIGSPEYRPEVLRNTLHLARGDGTFAEVAQFAGLAATEWSWGVAFVDVDLDGWEDVLVTTGSNHDHLDADLIEGSGQGPAKPRKGLSEFGRLERACLAFRNRHDLTFEEVGAAWGFNHRGVAHGMALADLDNDGDLDVVVNELNGEASVYRNDGSAPRVLVRLHGHPPNTRGIGARIELRGGPVTQSQSIVSGGRYLSSDDPARVFAATPSAGLSLEVRWPSGRISRVESVQANHAYEVTEPPGDASVPTPPPALAPASPFFKNVSASLSHQHVDQPFDDFARQPLLFHRLSQAGPGVSWYDLDGDGWDDVIVGGGKGGRIGVFLNDRQGGWQRLKDGVWDERLPRDQTTLLGWTPAEGRRALIAGFASYEEPSTARSVVRRYAGPAEPGEVEETLEVPEGSIGPLALADVDGDGDLDLFVGGRVRPGRYPESVPSTFWRMEGGRFQPDPAQNKLFADLGLVSGAIFTDLDGDGAPDLVLACEWGPVRVFHNEGGVLRERTRDFGLAEARGFWNGVATGDFDEDGRQDLLVSNWGRNTRFQATPASPWRVYAGDFDGDGVVEVVEANDEAGLGRFVPWRTRDVLAKAMPAVRERFSSYRDYARAAVEDVIGPSWTNALFLQATTFDTTLFLNRGDHFVAKPLPKEAQFAPAFGVAVADFDGDGHEDVFLAQNFFATEIETSRADAGRGLWLRGDGQGGFVPVAGQESGLQIYGEQRGAAVADYDGDGRMDLLVGQNRGPTQLFHNERAAPGLRVRLQGGPLNPHGVGATVRLGAGQRWGPAREVHAGSGYWSQDSAVLVLARPAGADRVWVRWPNARTNTYDLPPGTREVRLSPAGGVEVRP